MTLRAVVVLGVALTAARALADEPQHLDRGSPAAEQSNLEQHFGTDRVHLVEAGEVVARVRAQPQGSAGRSNLEQHFGADLQRLATGEGVAGADGSYGPDQRNFDQHFGTDRFGSDEDVGSAAGETSR